MRIWPYLVLGIIINSIKICLEFLGVNVVYVYIVEFFYLLCLMVIEYRVINRFVKIKFFENKDRLKLLIVFQFIIFEILNVFSEYFIEHGMTIG